MEQRETGTLAHRALRDLPSEGRQDGDGRDGVHASDDALAAVRREGAGEAYKAEPNRLLRSLPLEEYERLLPMLTPMRLCLKHVLVEPEVPIADVYFMRDGVASMIATQQEGGDIEVGTIGCEGFVGLPILFGAELATNQVIVQVAGDAWRMRADDFRRVVDERPQVRHPFLLFAQYFFDQLSQGVACNRLHTLEERCARWLLMTHDRVHGENFELTQEFLGVMLGVRRAGVSVAMGLFQSAAIVRYSRGRVEVLDREGLERASCDCYRITRSALDRLLGAPELS